MASMTDGANVRKIPNCPQRAKSVAVAAAEAVVVVAEAGAATSAQSGERRVVRVAIAADKGASALDERQPSGKLPEGWPTVL